ncbi:hypothetical protein ACQZV8_07440 [Magnetococcales bacterium HHB-1]
MEKIPDILRDSYWHVTYLDRYQKIVEDGYIDPEPDLDDKERWSTAEGPDHYPFVRKLGGVSIFDFHGFDEKKYIEKYPFSMWGAFIPCPRNKTECVWIEIKVDQLGDKFISGKDLLDKWKRKNSYANKIMPLIECANIGRLSKEFFRRCLFYDNKKQVYTELK